MLIHDFMTRYLVATRNVSQNTVLSYRDSYVLLLQCLNECYGLKPENLRVQDVSPDRVKSFLEWLEEHRNELMDNWEKAQRGEPLDKIEPLK